MIGSTDLDVMHVAWGSFLGEPSWDPLCDLEQDGVIDSTDLGILAVHWGEFGNWINEYHWYVDNTYVEMGPILNHLFALYSRTAHNVTLMVVDIEGHSSVVTRMHTVDRDIAVLGIWPSMERYMGSIQFSIPVGKYVVIRVGIDNLGTIIEYTDNGKGDFPSGTNLGLYAIYPNGDERSLRSWSDVEIRRYGYAENATC